MTLASEAFRVARAGIRAVDPRRCVEAHLSRTENALVIDEVRLPLGRGQRVHLVAIGKAARSMVDGARHRLRGWVAGGVAVVRERSPVPPPGIHEWVGEHPIPGAGSARAAERTLAYVRAVPREDLVLFLVSGGASSLFEAPCEGIRIGSIGRTNEILLSSGAPIGSMNVIRRHLSAVKGGRLAEATRARSFATLAISDVVGDAPHEIASGPTVPDPTTFADAWDAVEEFRLERRLPPDVLAYLRQGVRGHRPETPKPTNRRLRRAPFCLVASTRTALLAAAAEARRLSYRPILLSSRIVGETRDVARMHAAILGEFARARRASSSIALLSGGETTVTLPPHPGRGGRNQEFALSAIRDLEGLSNAALLSIGSDGIDGPTDAAGGVVTGATARRARSLGIDVRSSLARHSAYGALEALGALLKTGPTGTNVSDLHVGLVGGRPPERRQRRYGRK